MAGELSELRTKPAGYAKDLFLLDFMEQNITASQAYEAYFLTKSPKSKHSTLLLKKTASKKLRKLFDCMDTNTTRALKKTPECAELSVSYVKLSSLAIDDSKDVKQLAELIDAQSHEKAAKIEKMLLIKNSIDTNASELFSIYFDTSKAFRAKFLDKNITIDDGFYKDAKIKRAIKWALFDKNASNLQNTLSNLECKNIQDSEALFFESLLKIKYQKNPIECLAKSAKIATRASDRDRSIFWLYLYTGDTAVLRKAANDDLNFYSKLAQEATDTEPKHISFVDYSSKFTKTSDINGSDPFFWQELRAKIKNANKVELEKIEKQLAYKNTESYYLYAKEKATGFKNDYFLLPYKDSFEEFNSTQKTLLHAIGRQESTFIPGDVSGAYAIGVMQIIPILGEELAQKRKEKISFFELFEPSKNISYAATHFKWLEAEVSHPILIAVSFNAGYGFFRRIEKNGLFTFKDEKLFKYEPFWSIENIPYDETRDYAKKVALNYSVYSEKFDEKISLTRLLENLIELRRK